MYATQPSRIAAKPMVIALAWVSAEAANAASAIGGVIIDIMPK